MIKTEISSTSSNWLKLKNVDSKNYNARCLGALPQESILAIIGWALRVSYWFKQGKTWIIGDYFWLDDGNPLGLIEEEFFLSLKILSHVANENVCDFQLQSVYNGEMGRIGFIKIR